MSLRTHAIRSRKSIKRGHAMFLHHVLNQNCHCMIVGTDQPFGALTRAAPFVIETKYAKLWHLRKLCHHHKTCKHCDTWGMRAAAIALGRSNLRLVDHHFLSPLLHLPHPDLLPFHGPEPLPNGQLPWPSPTSGLGKESWRMLEDKCDLTERIDWTNSRKTLGMGPQRSFKSMLLGPEDGDSSFGSLIDLSPSTCILFGMSYGK